MNQREMKFRAWDTVEKEMREVAMLRWENGELVRIAGYWKGTRDNGWTDYDPKSGKYELMQFTGLKDKNGKEIYEGDIVKAFYNDANDLEKESNSMVVVWGASAWGLESVRDGQRFSAPSFNNWSILEVIGNIYSNPELIN